MTVTSRLHRQKDKARQRKTEEKVERRPVVTPRYEAGGETQALVRPARDRGLPLPKTCVANQQRKKPRKAKEDFWRAWRRTPVKICCSDVQEGGG